MSTILDALRKLEEERHSRTADARSRLLLSPSRQIRPFQQQRSSWKARRKMLSVVGLTVAGFSAGAGFVFWQSYPGQTSSVTPTIITPSAPVASAPHESPPTPLQSASNPSSLDQESNSSPLPTSSSRPLPSAPSEEQYTALASVSSVQRSPFAAASPAPRETTSTQREIAPVAKHKLAPPSASMDDSLQDEPRYEVLLPSGATHTVKSSTPPLTRTATPPTSTSSGTALSFLQWSSDPEKRIAFLRVNGGPLTMAHEGDTIGGYTVVEIRQNAVELQSGETRLTLRPH